MAGRQNTQDLVRGGSVVIDLISELQEETGSSYHLILDNLFTLCNLVGCLTSKGIAYTGTLCSNRLGDAPLKSVKEMEKLKRGFFDFATNTKNGIVVVRWNNNSVVNTVSNKVGVHPLQSAKRWSRSDAKRIDTGVSLSLSSIVTKQWVEWTRWTKTWTNIAWPSGPRSASGLYLHSAWTSVSSKCGTCFDWHRATLTRPTTCWLSVTPLPGPVMLVVGLVIQPQVVPEDLLHQTAVYWTESSITGLTISSSPGQLNWSVLAAGWKRSTDEANVKLVCMSVVSSLSTRSRVNFINTHEIYFQASRSFCLQYRYFVTCFFAEIAKLWVKFYVLKRIRIMSWLFFSKLFTFYGKYLSPTKISWSLYCA